MTILAWGATVMLVLIFGYFWYDHRRNNAQYKTYAKQWRNEWDSWEAADNAAQRQYLREKYFEDIAKTEKARQRKERGNT